MMMIKIKPKKIKMMTMIAQPKKIRRKKMMKKKFVQTKMQTD